MKTKMFSVFDSKAACYGTPFFMPMESMAIRAFSDLVNDGTTLVSKHPEDFSLFLVGSFEDSLATFDSVKPTNLVTASSLKRQPVLQDFSLRNGVINHAEPVMLDMSGRDGEVVR